MIYSHACRVAPGASSPPGRSDLQPVVRAFLQGVVVKDGPAFQLYARDIYTGTSDLSSAEFGLYMRGLIWSWDNGPLPLEEERRARVLLCELSLFSSLWKAVAHLWILKPNGFVNERLEEERLNQRNYRREQARRGRMGGRPKTNTRNRTANPDESSSPSSPKDQDLYRGSDLHLDPSKDLSENGHGVWRAPAEKRPASILHGPELRRHGQHDYCGQYVPCVPLSLHREFMKVGKKTHAEMMAWYYTTDKDYASRPVGDDAFAFWRNLFAAWVGTVTARPRDTKHSRLSAILKGTT